ncbi:hypothetical protein VTK26DRAFT_7258 [Humicola hyalothermophila]
MACPGWYCNGAFKTWSAHVSSCRLLPSHKAKLCLTATAVFVTTMLPTNAVLWLPVSVHPSAAPLNRSAGFHLFARKNGLSRPAGCLPRTERWGKSVACLCWPWPALVWSSGKLLNPWRRGGGRFTRRSRRSLISMLQRPSSPTIILSLMGRHMCVRDIRQFKHPSGLPGGVCGEGSRLRGQRSSVSVLFVFVVGQCRAIYRSPSLRQTGCLLERLHLRTIWCLLAKAW